MSAEAQATIWLLNANATTRQAIKIASNPANAARLRKQYRENSLIADPNSRRVWQAKHEPAAEAARAG
jgi:hypothetical protein